MSFDWNDYLKFASITKQLAEIEDKEMPFYSISKAAHRASISRAYYAVFGIACDFVLEHRSHEILLSKSPSVHGELIDYFKRSSGTNERKIGKLLDDLRRNRNLADYTNELDDTPENLSRDSLDNAKKILNLLNKL
jgi:hypothetical protein